MKCELCCCDNCLDLPSLAEIHKQYYCHGIHFYLGHVILESMIWQNSLKTIRYSATDQKEDPVWKKSILLHC